ncbi:ethanolamine utilization protein EutA [Nocardioides terrae]|uniref:Ethanolamine utilization protein EutA n=1 Tax=Nocardioides terrae TaxID=574651 RepID=A0A1I1EEW9_9ACTN|nr:ethanolamine ammonia-lyase reactivating factor EutA [Nocardioides terrae]SFB85714.1 ethanolamine utilization protein EutA [Nocardioides terrae]
MDRTPHASGPAGLDGVERFILHSAGLDVGTATSHLTISQLVLTRPTAALSSRLTVTERTELFHSEIRLTPYDVDGRIDAAGLADFLDKAYVGSGFTPADIDSGVVIVTGEAARRDNAPRIAQLLARSAGSFVCVAAGDHYEAVLAVHGSGAVALSEQGRRVLNVDIGGGTTKLAIAYGGEVEHTAALSVGARLLAWDVDGRLTRIEPAGRWFLDQVWSGAAVGHHVSENVLDEVAKVMADLLGEALGTHPRSALLASHWVTEPLPLAAMVDIDVVTFSGGVSEFVYGREARDFGDLGARLGAEVRRRFATDMVSLGSRLTEPTGGIRATVLGAAEHSLQASGVTSHVDSALLPTYGLKAVRARVVAAHGLADRLAATRARFEVDGIDLACVFALALDADPDYTLLRAIGEELVRAATEGAPLYVAVDADVAAALGRILSRELGWAGPLIVIDGISVGDFDYVDIGRPLGAVDAVPVTVKALNFLHR